MGPRVGGGFRPRVTRENIEDAKPERAVLVLLAPDPRRQVHERRERAVAATHRPHAAVHVGVERCALAHEADGGGCVASFLDGRLEPRALLVGQGVVVSGQRSLFDVDGVRKVGGHRDEPILGDVVRPLDHFRDRPPRAGDLAGLLEQFDADFLRLAVQFPLDRARFHGQRIHAQAIILERILRDIEAQVGVVRHAVADLHHAISEPDSEVVLLQRGHGDVDIGLELAQPFGLVGDRTVADTFEGDAEALLEGLGEGDEVGHVHLHLVRVAVIADDLRAETGNLAIPRGGPPALCGPAHHDHGSPVIRIPRVHGLERRDDLVVVVAVLEREDVPAVRRPLVRDAIAVVGLRHYAADQRIVDAGVVE